MSQSSPDTSAEARRIQLQNQNDKNNEQAELSRRQLQLLDVEIEYNTNVKLKTNLQARLDESITRVKEWQDEESRIRQGVELKLQEIDEIREEEKRVFTLQAKHTDGDNSTLRLEEERLEIRLSSLLKDEREARKRFLRFEFQIANEEKQRCDLQQEMAQVTSDGSGLEKKLSEMTREVDVLASDYKKSWGQEVISNEVGVNNSAKQIEPLQTRAHEDMDQINSFKPTILEQATTIKKLQDLIQTHKGTLAAKDTTILQQESKIKELESILDGSIVVSSELVFPDPAALQENLQRNEHMLKEKNTTISQQAAELKSLEKRIKILQSSLETHKSIVVSLTSERKTQGCFDQDPKEKKSTVPGSENGLQVEPLAKEFEIMERNWTSPRAGIFIQWLKDNSEMNVPSVIEAFSEFSMKGFSVVDIIKLLNKKVQTLMRTLRYTHYVKSNIVLNPILDAVKSLYELNTKSLKLKVAIELYVPHRTDALLRALGLRYTAFGLLELGEAGSVELLTFDDGYQVIDRRSNRAQRIKTEQSEDKANLTSVGAASMEGNMDIELLERGKRKRSSPKKITLDSPASSSDSASKKSKIL